MAEIKAWITVKGRHIPIMEGESKEDAIKRLKEGARKGKSTRPISKEAYEKKAKAADKAYKAIGPHTERLLKADKRIKEGDTSDEAKKERMNAERTLKEAGQRFQKRSDEHQEAVKHRKYSSIKVRRKEKPSEQSNKEDFVVDYKIPDKVPKDKKLSASAKRKQAIQQMMREKGIENLGTPKTQEEAKQLLSDYSKAKSPSLDNITDAKNQAELNSKLKERGLSLDSAYQKAHSDDRVTMYDKDGNSYTGTYNQYNDGGREIVNIRKEKSWQDKDAEVKAKQIARAEKQKAERNPDGAPYKEDRNDKNVKALRSMAEKAETRKIVTDEQAFEGKQASWTPKTGDKISDVGYNEAQNKLYEAPVGTTFEMTSRDGDYVGEYTKQSDGSWKGSQKYKSGYKMPTTVYTPKGFAMNVVGKDIKVTNNGLEKKADWRDVDTKPKKVNLSTTYTNAMKSSDIDKVESAIAKLTKNGGSSGQIKDLKEKLRRLRHSEYKEDPTHYNGKGMY